MIDKATSGPSPPEQIFVFVEIPKGSQNKYRYNEELGTIVLENVLRKPCPGSYGFIPKTKYDDGFPLDVLVLVSEAVQSGILIQARPIGLLRMITGEYTDDKLLAVPANDKEFSKVSDISDIPKYTLKEVTDFFEHAEGEKFKEWFDAEKAKKAILHAIELYKRGF